MGMRKVPLRVQKREKKGIFEEAQGGTIFLDEIGDAAMEFQVTLLRVLQEKEVRRVGGTKRIPVDVRVITATNRDLRKLVQDMKFRKDLFYRLNTLTLNIPALNERIEDILILVETYLRRLSNNRFRNIDEFFTDNAFAKILEYTWDGNIRELIGVIEYLINIKEENVLIKTTDLPEYIVKTSKTSNIVSCNEDEHSMLWILRKIYENKRLGRIKLEELAKKEGIMIRQAKIRFCLKKLKERELIDIDLGLGNRITQKGIYELNRDCGI